MVKIIDSTLREGAQAAGVRFGVGQSVQIARALVDIGVDTIECGHPYVGPDEAERVRAVVKACDQVPVLAHARARREDIDAVKAVGARWVGVFAGVNATSRQNRIRTEGSIASLAAEAIRHAKEVGLAVRFTIEDASRTPWAELAEGFAAALEAGADRLCFADTVGTLCPWEVEAMIARLREAFPQTDLEVHFHDDRGMAEANALVAVRAGANWISSSVNGLGERCGITDTLTLMANLDGLGCRPLQNGARLPWTSQLVQAHSRFVPDHRRPVAGRNAFTHVAKLHCKAVERDEAVYSWVEPARLGRTTRVNPPLRPAEGVGLVNRPQVISATELRHHRKGPGDRYLMLDERVVPDARQYCIVRHIPELDDYGAGHVDGHVHDVDSLFLFTGKADDLTGLKVEVELGDETFVVESPASVFIPSGLFHSYRVLGGSGLFFNHVLAGEYNSSLLDLPEAVDAPAEALASKASARVVEICAAKAAPVEEAALALLQAFFDNRLPGAVIDRDQPILEVFDSLMFLDLFLHLEEACGDVVQLDDIAASVTFGDLIAQLAGPHEVKSFAEAG